jgi:hypothetical protein
MVPPTLHRHDVDRRRAIPKCTREIYVPVGERDDAPGQGDTFWADDDHPFHDPIGTSEQVREHPGGVLTGGFAC